MSKNDFQIEFNTEILWLRRFFERSKINPKNSVLEQMIADRVEELRYPYIKKDLIVGTKSSKKTTPLALKFVEIEECDDLLKIWRTWQRVLRQQISVTDRDTLKVIRAVFINKSMNLTGAGAKYFHYSHPVTYRIIRKWFQELNIAFFNAR